MSFAFKFLSMIQRDDSSAIPSRGPRKGGEEEDERTLPIFELPLVQNAKYLHFVVPFYRAIVFLFIFIMFICLTV